YEPYANSAATRPSRTLDRRLRLAGLAAYEPSAALDDISTPFSPSTGVRQPIGEPISAHELSHPSATPGGIQFRRMCLFGHIPADSDRAADHSLIFA
ncbi:MAG: hypothetical protein WB500_16625, partial [Rhodoplanes sp.]